MDKVRQLSPFVARCPLLLFLSEFAQSLVSVYPRNMWACGKISHQLGSFGNIWSIVTQIDIEVVRIFAVAYVTVKYGNSALGKGGLLLWRGEEVHRIRHQVLHALAAVVRFCMKPYGALV